MWMPRPASRIVDPKKLKWFRNTKFRQAVSYAIDRESIIKSVYSGRAIPAYGFVTPGNKKWFNPNMPNISARPGQGARVAEGNRD